MRKIPDLSPELREELAALETMPEEHIDTTEIPERTTDRGPVHIGLFYRGGKKSVTIRLDADMVDWYKSQGRGWQTKMNWVLRLYFTSHRKVGVKFGRP